jgi:hypothetical protein
MCQKKILVLSHNAFSKTQNNGKTLESFFRKWEKSNLAQIFLQPENPDFEFCDNYFRITDYEAMSSAFFNGEIGHRLLSNSNESEFIKKTNRLIQRLYLDRRSGVERKGLSRILHKGFVERVPFLIFLRDIIWRMAKWDTKKLNDWIEEFSPDVLFFQGSSSVFGYKIALSICEKHRIPLVLQLTDDYTRPLYKYSVLELVNKLNYRRIFKRAISKSVKVIAVSDYMAREYGPVFGGSYTTLMNSVEVKDLQPEPLCGQEIRLLYAGNVLLKRWEVLEKIGKALSHINSRHNLNCILHIHSPTPIPQDIVNRLSIQEAIRCGRPLNQNELWAQIEASNILVHVESFDEKMKRITRLSISTKIPEYLASRRCIFAVGPDEVASIKYLSENRYAHTGTSLNLDCIQRKLEEIIVSSDLRSEYVRSARAGYLANHSPEIALPEISKIVDSA